MPANDCLYDQKPEEPAAAVAAQAGPTSMAQALGSCITPKSSLSKLQDAQIVLRRPAGNIWRMRSDMEKWRLHLVWQPVLESEVSSYKKAGAEKGKYVVIHGIESDSAANMQSKGDNDSLLPVGVWAEIAKEIRGVKPLFVIPHEKERDDVEEAVGADSSIMFITTPGQLAALIDDSAWVITTNTAAAQLANARVKPRIFRAFHSAFSKKKKQTCVST